MYQKNTENGYIASIVKGVTDGNISEEEYNEILHVIRSKPTAESGYAYRLKENLSWELYELPLVEAPAAYTAEQLAKMTNAELSTILAEMGISGSMTKANMIALILDKQNALR